MNGHNIMQLSCLGSMRTTQYGSEIVLSKYEEPIV